MWLEALEVDWLEQRPTRCLHDQVLGDRTQLDPPLAAETVSQRLELASRARLKCVDAFRGIVMARMLIGLPLIPAVAALQASKVRDELNQQLHHAVWHGLTLVDFSFAAYVLIAGLSIPLSFNLDENGAGCASHVRRAFRRALVLFFLGILYNGGLTHRWPDIRLAGVFQRIAICYFLGVVLYLNASRSVRLAVIMTILLGYWLILVLVPVPGGIAGDFSFEGNLAAWLDHHFLPGQAYFGTWDPEGILTTIPAVATCLIGIGFGEFLQSGRTPFRKLLYLLIAGVAAVNIGALWHLVFPINKSLWTSSYVLVTAGIAAIVLGACYLVTDIWRSERLLFPFIVIGRNVLAAFLAMTLIPISAIAERFVGGDVAFLLGPIAPLARSLTESLLVWLFLFWLYRKDIVIKV